MVEFESIIRIPAYMVFNILPFLLPGVSFYMGWSYFVATILILGSLSIWGNGFPSAETVRRSQYIYTERHNQKYCSLRMVWPKSLHPPNYQGKPIIFCMVPHGVAPMAACGYPFYSKLFNSRFSLPTVKALSLTVSLPFYLLGRILRC